MIKLKYDSFSGESNEHFFIRVIFDMDYHRTIYKIVSEYKVQRAILRNTANLLKVNTNIYKDECRNLFETYIKKLVKASRELKRRFHLIERRMKESIERNSSIVSIK